jgi:glycosyltransferase involved in cell wall biosynthesis
MKIAICFGQFGPYHHARVVALQTAAHEHRADGMEHGVRVLPVQIAAATATYEWKAGEEIKRPRDEEPESAEADGDSVSPAGAGRGQTQRQQKLCEDLRTLCAGVEEEVSPLDVFLKARRLFRGEKVDVAFLPSYSPARYFALFAAAKSLGLRTVMMNESHAGTEQATGWKRWIKRQIVKRFDAAFVGGEPHKRHFASLGIPADKIFTGYDAVDGEFFAQRADEIRAAQKRSQESGDRGQSEGGEDSVSVFQNFGVSDFRKTYGLPQRYFLSLGRMVEKKNLSTLVEAYARFARASVERSRAETGNLNRSGAEIAEGKPELSETADGGDAAATKAENRKLNTAHCVPALVFVGSGELEGTLREQARSLGLRVVERTDWRVEKTGHGLTRINTDGSERLAADRTGGDVSCRVTPALADSPREKTDDCKLTPDDSAVQRGAVFFYGFRQIEENPVFYALAEAFVLPSLKEEWGLVVNEAMAAGLPVIVSRTAGCAEDLLPGSESWQCSVGSGQLGGSETTENCQLKTENSLEQRSNGFVFDPSSVDALSDALRRIADQETKRPKDEETNGLTEMGKRSREIVAKFGCENFAKQALSAARAAQQA